MSRWRFDRHLVIALSRRQVVLARDGEPTRCLDVPDGVGDLAMDMPAERVARLRDWLAGQIDLLGAARMARRVACTGELSRVWTLEIPLGIRSRRELEEVALARCVGIFGASARSWSIAADWRASGPVTCWALPGWLANACSDVRAPRDALLPEVLAALVHDLPRHGWAAVRLPQSAALVHTDKGRVCQVSTLALDEGEDVPSRVAVELLRVSRRVGGEGRNPWCPMIDARTLHGEARSDVALAAVLAGSTRAARFGLPAWGSGPVDWLLGRASTRWQKATAGAAFVAAAGALAWVAAASARDTAATQSALARLEAARASMAAHASPASSPMLSPAQRLRLNAAVRRLNTPWGDVLDRLEEVTPDGVRIVAIESNGDRPTVRLKVGGADMDTLVQYADELAKLPAFTRADLVQQDADPATATATTYLTFDLALRSPGEIAQ